MSGATSSKRYAAIMGSEHPVHQSGGRELNADTSGTAAIERDDAHRMTPVHFSSKNTQSGRGQSRLNESRSLPISPAMPPLPPLPSMDSASKFARGSLPSSVSQRSSVSDSARSSSAAGGSTPSGAHALMSPTNTTNYDAESLQGLLVSSISQQLKSLQEENEMQRRRLALCEREREKLLRPQRQRPPHVSGDDIERTLQHLDAASKGLKSAGIQAFLTQIHGIVSGMHKQLNDAHSEIQELSARNAVLQACLDRALHDRVVLRSNQDNDALLLDVDQPQAILPAEDQPGASEAGGSDGVPVQPGEAPEHAGSRMQVRDQRIAQSRRFEH